MDHFGTVIYTGLHVDQSDATISDVTGTRQRAPQPVCLCLLLPVTRRGSSLRRLEEQGLDRKGCYGVLLSIGGIYAHACRVKTFRTAMVEIQVSELTTINTFHPLLSMALGQLVCVVSQGKSLQRWEYVAVSKTRVLRRGNPCFMVVCGASF
jgi:hypothetical protein